MFHVEHLKLRAPDCQGGGFEDQKLGMFHVEHPTRAVTL